MSFRFRANILLFLFVFVGFYIIIFLQHEMRSSTDQIPSDVFSGLQKSIQSLQLRTQSFRSFLNPHRKDVDVMEEIDQNPFFNDDGVEDSLGDVAGHVKGSDDPRGRRGELFCQGVKVDSEVIYWRVVPGDLDFESPITPHHDEHHEKYLTFEYDHGGW